MTDLESRLGRLEQAMSGVRQRVDDHETDLRGLGSLVADHAVLRERFERIQADLNNVAQGQREIVERMDREAKERADERERAREKEESREERERKDRFVRITTLVTLLLVFISTSAAVIALVLT